MLVVRVELESAITGEMSEIARMIIANDGTGTGDRGNYWARAAKGTVQNDHMIPAAIMHESRKLRHAEVKDYPRQSLHVWNLVARMLQAMGYK
jgi:hypothetical protein